MEEATDRADDEFDILGDGIDAMDFNTSADPSTGDNTSDAGSTRRKKRRRWISQSKRPYLR